MFPKRLTELTAADIQGVVDRGVQEDVTVELKQTLSAKDGAADVWFKEQKAIGNEAKRALIKELVAFANTDGGTLILGIQEDGEKRASAITPLPACAQLADRLAAIITSSTDPKLVTLEYAGVPTEADGSGVCVFRIPQSHRAPHRDTDSKECYSRVGDRSVPMEMRQIQDLVLQRSRGLSDARAELDKRSDAMSVKVGMEITRFSDSANFMLHGVSMRATAVPLEDVFVPRIHSNRSFRFNSPDLVHDGSDGPSGLIGTEESCW